MFIIKFFTDLSDILLDIESIKKLTVQLSERVNLVFDQNFTDNEHHRYHKTISNCPGQRNFCDRL